MTDSAINDAHRAPASPPSPEIANQARSLRAQLHYHAHQYYTLDASQIPDAEYDRLFQELQALEAAHLGL